MADRLKDLLPFLLVAVILLGFYATRADGPLLSLVSVAALSPTPVLAEPAVDRTPAATVRNSARPACVDSAPRFERSTARLKALLGGLMGVPSECEHDADAQGNKEQHTTTGLAYYRLTLKLACFTDGFEHWAMRPDGVVLHWTGDAVDPPPEARQVSR